MEADMLRESRAVFLFCPENHGRLQGLEAGRRPRPVPFTSVGGSGILPAFAADAVRVDGREVQAYIAVYDGALSEEGQALIPGRCVR